MAATHYHLAQLNIARLLHPIDHEQIREFVDGLEHINALAERTPGFVWRFQTESGNATDAQHPWSQDPFVLVNMSVWESAEALQAYVYKSEHIEYFRKRAQWFEKPSQAHYVLWWIPAGHVPTIQEAADRLEHYRQHGPTARAFWFGKLHPAPSHVLSES